MEHDEFVEKYNTRQISVAVERNKASTMYDTPELMPYDLRKKQAFIRTLAFGGVIIGLVLFFFITWWIALAVLFGGLFMFPVAQKDAASGVLQASLKYDNIFRAARDNGVIVIRESK